MHIDTGIASLIVSALGLLWVYFGFIVGIKEQLKELQTKVDVFWLAASKKMAEFMISPHTPELDKVLRKFVDGGHLSFDDLYLATSELHKEQRRAWEAGDKERSMWAGILLKRFEAEIELKKKHQLAHRTRTDT